MQNKKLLVISALAIYLVAGMCWDSAQALDFEHYNNTWHKTKLKYSNYICEERVTGFELLVKIKTVNERNWVYIEQYNVANEAFDAYLILMSGIGTWTATPISLAPVLGTADDMVLELESPITITITFTDPDLGVVTEVLEIRSLLARLTGKEKLGTLKSANTKKIVGESAMDLTLDAADFASCVGAIEVSGKLTNETKVPQEVIDAKDAAIAP